tara:strand:+ start:106 stop:486 length:381 start_codon:yes stop_codon:yes gene_type:complete
MANFAKLGKGNKVLKVEPIHNDCASTEQAGIDFLNGLYKTNDVWKQASYNTVGGLHLLGGTPFRKNYPDIGYTYDPERDAFIPPQPFNSWFLNEEKCVWEAPVAYPDDGQNYNWNETTKQWDVDNS